MATNNFHSIRGNYFTIEPADEFEYEDTRDNIRTELEGLAGIVYEQLEESEDGLRSYPGTVIAGLTLKNSREDIYAECKIVARSGYYSGINFDPVVAFYNAGTGEYIDRDEIDADEIISAAEYTHDRTVSKKAAEATVRRLERDAARLEKTAGQVLARYTTPLIKVGQFSNGEAVYERQLLRG